MGGQPVERLGVLGKELDGAHRLALSVYPAYDSSEDGRIWGQDQRRQPIPLVDSQFEFAREEGLLIKLALGDEDFLGWTSRL